MAKAFGKILLLGILTAGAAALFAEEAPDANITGKRIVILGDSITAGYGLNPDKAYPALLQEKIDEAGLPHTIVNAGVSGDTTAGGLRRIAWALGSGADVLVIALGGNDGLRGISPEETKRNLLAIADKAREKSPAIEILIGGMQMPDNMGAAFTSRFKAIFPEAASESESTLIAYLLEGVGGVAGLNQADRIHPTAEGQEIVAENVWQMLQPILTK